MKFSAGRPVGYPYRSKVSVQEDFVSGNATTGSIGALGWIATGGTTSVLSPSEANHYGVIRRDTTSSSGTSAQLLLGFTSQMVNPAESLSVVFLSRLNTNDANTTYRVGAASAFSQNPPTHGIYFEKTDGDTNIFCVTRAAGVNTGSRIDSGVAVSTDWVEYSFIRDAGGVHFFLNGTFIATLTANIPTTFVNPGLHILNSAAAAKTIDTDYFEMSAGLMRT